MSGGVDSSMAAAILQKKVYRYLVLLTSGIQYPRDLYEKLDGRQVYSLSSRGGLGRRPKCMSTLIYTM